VGRSHSPKSSPPGRGLHVSRGLLCAGHMAKPAVCFQRAGKIFARQLAMHFLQSGKLFSPSAAPLCDKESVFYPCSIRGWILFTRSKTVAGERPTRHSLSFSKWQVGFRQGEQGRSRRRTLWSWP